MSLRRISNSNSLAARIQKYALFFRLDVVMSGFDISDTNIYFWMDNEGDVLDKIVVSISGSDNWKAEYVRHFHSQFVLLQKF